MTRITDKFTELKAKNRKALIPFIMAGDPNIESSAQLLPDLVTAGADIIELGMPFSDPMADGPIIQQAGIRALQAGTTLIDVLSLVKKFRLQNNETPIILMGYYNPIYDYGVDRFLDDALEAGVDGLIIVDLPPEEDVELCDPATKKNIDFIRMITPTTDDKRAQKILQNANGFVYAVAITGITGTKKAEDNSMAHLAGLVKKHCDLPVALGFGIRTKDDAKMAARFFDAVVVGSALVEKLTQNNFAKAKAEIVSLVQQMRQAIDSN
ncbi:MAG: tryptophan synthase subunit alpha [Alphaproteobacteria bacterium]|nr:tryptophan synthase subunit alpha [Alphaproteobacteria bacterium]